MSGHEQESPPLNDGYLERILAEEPDPDVPEPSFDRRHPPRPGFGLRSFLRPHRAAITGGVLLVGVETAAAQVTPLLTQRAIDEGIVARDPRTVALIALIYLGAVVVRAVTLRWRLRWTGRLGNTLMTHLRVDTFTHIQRLSQSFFTNERAGRVLTRMTSDIDALTELLQDGIINMVVQGFTLVFVVGVLFWLNPTLAFVVVAVVLPTMLFLTLWFRGASERAFDALRERISEVLTDLQENLAGMRIVTGFNRQRYNAAVHREQAGQLRDAGIRTGKLQSLYGPSIDGVSTVGEIIILVVGGRMLLANELTIGELTAFLLYLTAFFAPIQQLVNLYQIYQSGQAAVRKLDALLRTEPTVVEGEHAVPLPDLTGAIAFDGVSFGYEPGQVVLHDVDLRLRAGETVAFVGPTGAGKSTLAKLVARVYDPVEGRVLIDGLDIRGATLDSLRRQVIVVPQEPFLFGGTVESNVRMGRPDATAEEVAEACHAVGLDTLLRQMPDGLRTVVTERGGAMSSGQRQLIALARALLARPRILVLDEATSNLDLASERAVERALDTLLEGRTALVIAHRLSTAMRADRVAVVADGRVVEFGPHHELLAANGPYAQMFATWNTHAQSA